MKVAFVILVILLGMAFAGYQVYSLWAIHERRVAYDAQVFGWAPSTREFVLKPGESWNSGATWPGNGFLHYTVRSTLPIVTGLQSSCVETGILTADKWCAVPNVPQVVNVTDSRTVGDMAIAAFLRDASKVQDNRVSVTLYTWDCIKNCLHQQ